MKCDSNQGYAWFESINKCENRICRYSCDSNHKLLWLELEASLIRIKLKFDSNQKFISNSRFWFCQHDLNHRILGNESNGEILSFKFFIQINFPFKLNRTHFSWLALKGVFYLFFVLYLKHIFKSFVSFLPTYDHNIITSKIV